MPHSLNLDALLRPIRDNEPAGEYLRWEPEYAEIEEARQSEDDSASQDVWVRDRKRANWQLVISQGEEFIRTKSKDIQIAAWMVEALAIVDGIAGMTMGLRMLQAIQDAFWTSAHPDSGDLELRAGIYEYLDDEKRLPLILKSYFLTEDSGLPRYSYLKYKESREVEDKLRKKPELEEELKAEGKIRAEDFDKSFAVSSREFYERLIRDLAECRQAVEHFNESLSAEDHYGRSHSCPLLSKTRGTLEEVSKLASQLLAKKPAPIKTTEEEEPEAEETTEASAETPSPEVSEEETPLQSSWDQDSAVAETPKPKPRSPIPRSGGPISSVEDAKQRIIEAAWFLRDANPGDPTSYLVVQSLSLGEVFCLSEGHDSANLFAAPSTEDRQRLRRLCAEMLWTELLNESERVLGGLEGKGWLDAQRYAIQAMNELGHTDAARASQAILGAALEHYPQWAQNELNDGTPCANGETTTWIKRTFVDRSAPEKDQRFQHYPPAMAHPAPTTPDEVETTEAHSEASRDPWDRAHEFLRNGDVSSAIATIAGAVQGAKTGRERFHRLHQQAELCFLLDRPGVAIPLLEGLARQIEELRLETWEDPATCARVLATLYRCLRGRDNQRARAVYQRLCQVDLSQALLLEEVPEG